MYEEESNRVRGNSYRFPKKNKMYCICWCCVDEDGMHEMESWAEGEE
jgi:hypothetical protein